MSFTNPPQTNDGEELLLCKIVKALQDGIDVTISGSDIEIGAVEIKNATTDDRAEVTAGGGVSVNLKQVAGASVATGAGTAAGSIRVELPTDGTGVLAGVTTVTTLTGTTSLTPGTGATNLGKAEDNVAASGDVGVMALAVRRDTAAASAPDGDYNTLNVDALGKLWSRPEGGAADNAVAVGNPNLVGGVAVAGSSYAPAYTAADAAVVAIDKDSGGQLSHIRTLTTTDNVTNTPVASSLSSSAAYETNRVAKASAGRLFVVNGYNSLGSAQFIQVHNTASLPGDGVAPIAVITVAASSNFSMDFGPLGIPCSTGITICNSTTGPTKTIGAANCYFTVSYT